MLKTEGIRPYEKVWKSENVLMRADPGKVFSSFRDSNLKIDIKSADQLALNSF